MGPTNIVTGHTAPTRPIIRLDKISSLGGTFARLGKKCVCVACATMCAENVCAGNRQTPTGGVHRVIPKAF